MSSLSCAPCVNTKNSSLLAQRFSWFAVCFIFFISQSLIVHFITPSTYFITITTLGTVFAVFAVIFTIFVKDEVPGVTEPVPIRVNGFQEHASLANGLCWFALGFTTLMFQTFVVHFVAGEWRLKISVICIIMVSIAGLATLSVSAIDPEVNHNDLNKDGIECKKDTFHTIKNLSRNGDQYHFFCKQCNKCCAGYDHHCMFLNTCIGMRNYRAFLITVTSYFVYASFMISVAVLAWYKLAMVIFGLNIDEILDHTLDLYRHPLSVTILLMLFSVGAMAYLVMTGYLFFYHIFLIPTNLTSRQFFTDDWNYVLEDEKEYITKKENVTIKNRKLRLGYTAEEEMSLIQEMEKDKIHAIKLLNEEPTISYEEQ